MNLLDPFTKYRYLLTQLVQREIKARYKQSVVGYAWVILNPIAQLLIYSFVFSIIFRFPTGDIPYSIFLFTALLPWTFLQNSVSASTQSLVNNSSLLKKIAFPREIIPYSVVFSKLIDFLFSLLVFIIFIIFSKVTIHSTFWLVIPLLFLQIILTIAVSLFLSAANLFYRDIQYLTNLLLMIWMYMTPVVYPASMVPIKYLWLYKLNPMVGIIEGYRSALFGNYFEVSIILWSIAVSIILFIISFFLFKKWESVFADIV
jgi:lipopolysaccharide transport system permease protein